ncbi:TPA: toxin, partial [Yersinia enterocolitica]|nr:toxin [Yersinia enterocolitica]
DCVDITIASICEDPNILSVRQRNSDREFTLINNQLPLVPSGRLLMLLVINNFPLEIIKLVNRIIEESLLSPNEIYDIFNVNKSDEMPILYYALQQGEYLIVLALGRLIECIPEGRRKEVLDAKDDRGIPGLHMAMLGGHVSSIKAYGKLLELIPENQRAELLDIKNPTEDHIFFQAIKRGDKEAAIAFFGLLDYLLLLEEEEFIAATDKNGNSLLTLCLKTGGNIARDTFNAVLDSVKNNSEYTAGQD